MKINLYVLLIIICTITSLRSKIYIIKSYSNLPLIKQINSLNTLKYPFPLIEVGVGYPAQSLYFGIDLNLNFSLLKVESSKQKYDFFTSKTAELTNNLIYWSNKYDGSKIQTPILRDYASLSNINMTNHEKLGFALTSFGINCPVEIIGKIGLTPTIETEDNTELFFFNYMKKLYKFEKNVIIINSVNLRTNNTDENYILFGEENYNIPYNDYSKANIKIDDVYVWKIIPTLYKVGDKTFENNNSEYIIFDLNNPLIIAPRTGDLIFDYIISITNKKCFKDNSNNLIQLFCNYEYNFKTLPMIQFYFNNDLFNIKWDNLFQNILIEGYEISLCKLVINPVLTQWTFGFPALENITIRLDLDNKIVGWKENNISCNNKNFALLYYMQIIITLLGLMYILYLKRKIN